MSTPRIVVSASVMLVGLALVLTAQAWAIRDWSVQRELRRALSDRSTSVTSGDVRLVPRARVQAPSVGLDAVGAGAGAGTTDEDVLVVAPLVYRAGEDGPLVVAGHRDVHFGALQWLHVGDAVLVTEGAVTRLHHVAREEIVEPDDLSLLHELGREEVVLVTCHPFRSVGPAPRRYVLVLQRA